MQARYWGRDAQRRMLKERHGANLRLRPVSQKIVLEDLASARRAMTKIYAGNPLENPTEARRRRRDWLSPLVRDDYRIEQLAL